MSTKLGTLTLDLIAKIGNFTGPIKNAEKQSATSFGKMREHVNTYGKSIVAGASVVAGALAAMTVQYVNQAAEIQRFATLAQTSTTDFQVMAIGAKQFGVEAEQLADIMKDFNEKIGEFTSTGAGGAKDAFEMLVKEQKMTSDEAMKLAQSISQVSGDQGLLMYVAALEKAGVSSDEMSFYLESVGSDLTKLAPLLANGGEGFRLWGEAAQKAGIIMDEYAIEKANILKVQMSLLTMQVQGARNQFMQAFIPAIIAAGGALTDTTEQTNLAADAGETLGNVFRGVAAVAIGVYATVKMLSNALAGLAVDAVNTKKLIDGAAEQGGFWSNLPGVKLANNFIFGAAATKATNSGVKMAAADNAKVAADSAATLNKIFSDTVSAQTAALAKLQQGQNKAGGNIKFGSKEFNDAMNADAKAAAAKSAADAQRLADEVARIREQVAYAYASKEKQIEMDLQKELADIRKAGMDQTYIDRATNRAQVEKDLYQAQMDFEINEYKMTEQEKLRAKLTIDQLTVTLDEQLTSKQLQGKLDAQKEAYLNEVQLLNLESAKRLADAQYYRNSELQNIAFQYEYERQQILLNKRLTEDERSTLVNESYRQQDRDVNDRRLDVELNYINAMGGDTSAEEGRMDRAQAIQDAFEWQLITQNEYQTALLESQAQYERDKQNLAMDSMNVLLSATSATWSNMTSMIKDAAGEQSGIYKMMFLAQQAFAITSATINAFQAYNQILASPWHLDFMSKTTAASIVLGMGMANVGMIAAQTISGMAHNGIDNIPREGTWLLDGGERVLNPQQNKDLTSYLQNQDSHGGGDVNITVQVTDSGVSAQSNQAEQKQLGMMIGNAVRAIIRQEKRQGGLLA